MKNLAFILIILIVSLSSYSQQIEFDNVLGKKNINKLNLLLKEFETITLKQEYPNLETKVAFKEFLKNTESNCRKLFEEDNLKLQIYCIPDSIWIDNKLISGKKGISIKTRYKCLNSKNEMIYTSSNTSCCKDKQKTERSIEQAKKDVQVNIIGLYIKALESIHEKTKFIKGYLDYIKTTASPMPNYLISKLIEKNKVDIDNYIVKRVVFINNVYR